MEKIRKATEIIADISGELERSQSAGHTYTMLDNNTLRETLNIIHILEQRKGLDIMEYEILDELNKVYNDYCNINVKYIEPRIYIIDLEFKAENEGIKGTCKISYKFQYDAYLTFEENIVKSTSRLDKNILTHFKRGN